MKFCIGVICPGFALALPQKNEKQCSKWQITGKNDISNPARSMVRSLASFPAKMTTNKTGSNVILETRLTETTSVQRKKGIPRLTKIVFNAISCYVPFPCRNGFLQSKSLFSQTNVSSGFIVL